MDFKGVSSNGGGVGYDQFKTPNIITIKQENRRIKVKPFQIADRGDHDNNIDLCNNEIRVPISISVNANTAIDPRDDPNDMSMINILSRW